MTDCDVLIVGAGPAGSTLARLLGQVKGLRVALVDARTLDVPYGGTGRIKSCGGLVAPDAQKVLARMRMPLPSRLLVSPQLFAVRTVDVGAGLVRHYQRFYLNLDREAFDRWLFDGVPQTVRKHTGASVLRINPTAGSGPILGKSLGPIPGSDSGYDVHCTDGSRFHARFIVGADGANSVVRRKLFPPLAVDRYLSVQERFAASAVDSHFAAFFDPLITDYYGWGLPKNDEYLLGVAMPEGAGAEQAFMRFKERLRPFGYDLGEPLRRETTLLLRPRGLPGHGVRADGTACLVGEAGGYVSPSSAEGFSHAFLTASTLVRSVSLAREKPASPHFFSEVCRIHQRLMWPLRLALWAKVLKKQVLYRPLPRALVMRSRLHDLGLGPDHE